MQLDLFEKITKADDLLHQEINKRSYGHKYNRFVNDTKLQFCINSLVRLGVNSHFLGFKELEWCKIFTEYIREHKRLTTRQAEIIEKFNEKYSAFLL